MTPRDPLKKVKSPAALKRILAAQRRKKSVFTNGVFDILHRGHITYLHQARKQGDLLIVALNDDESVKRLKGPSRPINTLADRCLQIAGLESVDYVTWFDEDTPLETILLLKPKVLIKGGDYSPSVKVGPKKMVGAEEVRSWGGQAKVISFVEGYSTTKLIEKARIKKV